MSNHQHESTAATDVRDVDVREAQRMLSEGAVGIDVREPGEWAEAHIAGTSLVPLGSFDPSGVPADQAVVLICRSGARSTAAARALHAAGRRDVVNMAGGVLAWAAAGLPLETGGPS